MFHKTHREVFYLFIRIESMSIVHYSIPSNYNMATTATVATISPIVFMKDNVMAEEE